MEKRKLEINEENVRLDKFIMNSISDLSRTLIQEYIKEGHVLVNGKIEKASYKITKFLLRSHRNTARS